MRQAKRCRKPLLLRDQPVPAEVCTEHAEQQTIGPPDRSSNIDKAPGLPVVTFGQQCRQQLCIVQVNRFGLVLSLPIPVAFGDTVAFEHMVARGHDEALCVGVSDPGVLRNGVLNGGEPLGEFYGLLLQPELGQKRSPRLQIHQLPANRHVQQLCKVVGFGGQCISSFAFEPCQGGHRDHCSQRHQSDQHRPDRCRHQLAAQRP